MSFRLQSIPSSSPHFKLEVIFVPATCSEFGRMVKVKVTNNLNVGIVQVKEGNAGVFNVKCIIEPGRSFTLTLDPNATYREYVLITLPNNKQLEKTFSSDDAQEYKEIIVKEEKVGSETQYSWEGVRRDERRDRVLQVDKESPTLFQKFKKFLGLN